MEGQCFEVLKTRYCGGEQTLILRRPPHGTYTVPAEWTDWSLPSSRSDLLALDRLIAVAQLVNDLGARQKQNSENAKKEVDA